MNLKRTLLFIIFLLALISFSPSAKAQFRYNPVQHGAGAPSNPCDLGRLWVNDSNGDTYSCNNGSWRLIIPITGSGTANRLAYWTSSSVLGALGAGTTTQVLHGNASGAPSFSALDLANDVGSSILPAANNTVVVLNGSVAYCADAGANDTYACSLSPVPSAYVTGARYRFKANTANTGAATINLNSLGAKTIKKVAGGITIDLADNDIRVGQIVEISYDGTNMQMQSQVGNVAGITNSAGVNVVPVSDGTNLAANGTNVSLVGSSTIQITAPIISLVAANQVSEQTPLWGAGSDGVKFQIDGSGRIVNYNNATPTNGQLLIGNADNTRFDAATLTAGTGVSVTNDPSAITLTNTLPGPSVVCSNTAASTAISGTASKTYFSLNCLIPANTLTAGKTIKLEARGVYTAAVANTLTQTVDLCTVSGCGSGTVVQLAATAAATPGAVTNQGWLLDENSNLFTAGSSGTLDTQGYAAYQTAALVITFDPTPNTATATINTTVDQYLSISVTWSSNSATNTITLRNFKTTVQ